MKYFSYIILLFGIIFCSCNNSKVSSVDSIRLEDTLEDTIKDTIKEVRDTVDSWSYREYIDEMNDSKTRIASLKSTNTITFSFPYNHGTYMYISVRKTKKYGTDVMLIINSGQLLCSSYDGTDYVSIRFDDKSPIKFYTNEPNDGSSDCLFLRNPKKFIDLAKKAKIIKIEAPFFEEGWNVFKFATLETLN
jgi:hypothetical protein